MSVGRSDHELVIESATAHDACSDVRQALFWFWLHHTRLPFALVDRWWTDVFGDTSEQGIARN